MSNGRSRDHVWLSLPAMALMVPVYVGSLCFLAWFSVLRPTPGAAPGSGGFTTLNFLRIVDPLYVGYIGTTIQVGLVSAAGAVLISYPISYWLTRSTSRWRPYVLGLVVLSMFVVSVVRVFAWTLVLGRTGFVNSILTALHVVERPVTLLYSVTSVVVVEIHYVLPFVTLTLVASIRPCASRSWSSWSSRS